MRQVIFDIYISPDEYLKRYQGLATGVSVVSREGLRVKFPANILQRFLTHDGIRGSFVISFDDNNKFIDIQRLS